MMKVPSALVFSRKPPSGVKTPNEDGKIDALVLAILRAGFILTGHLSEN